MRHERSKPDEAHATQQHAQCFCPAQWALGAGDGESKTQDSIDQEIAVQEHADVRVTRREVDAKSAQIVPKFRVQHKVLLKDDSNKMQGNARAQTSVHMVDLMSRVHLVCEHT
jgi:hypothetical protein